MKKCSCLEVEQLSQNENITIIKSEFYEILSNGGGTFSTSLIKKNPNLQIEISSIHQRM
jgi:hypothetical protein